MLAYQSWVLSRFPNLKIHFTINVTPRDTSRIDESTVNHVDASLSTHTHVIDQSLNDRDNTNNQYKYL